MKKLEFLICLFFLISTSKAQIKPVDYGPPQKSPSYDQIIRTGAAVQQANAASDAANAEAMKSNYERINLNKLLGQSNKYKYVVLNKISGWMTEENRSSIFDQLTAAGKYVIINPETKKRKYIAVPDSIINNDNTILLDWYRDAPNSNDRITHFVLKDSAGNIIFDADYKNKSYSEILRPLMTNYNYSKEDALKKIKEFKELKDLGVITQEEFDAKILPLKSILIDN